MAVCGGGGCRANKAFFRATWEHESAIKGMMDTLMNGTIADNKAANEASKVIAQGCVRRGRRARGKEVERIRRREGGVTCREDEKKGGSHSQHA